MVASPQPARPGGWMPAGAVSGTQRVCQQWLREWTEAVLSAVAVPTVATPDGDPPRSQPASPGGIHSGATQPLSPPLGDAGSPHSSSPGMQAAGVAGSWARCAGGRAQVEAVPGRWCPDRLRESLLCQVCPSRHAVAKGKAATARSQQGWWGGLSSRMAFGKCASGCTPA